jgi:hypothetical protein
MRTLALCPRQAEECESEPPPRLAIAPRALDGAQHDRGLADAAHAQRDARGHAAEAREREGQVEGVGAARAEAGVARRRLKQPAVERRARDGHGGPGGGPLQACTVQQLLSGRPASGPKSQDSGNTARSERVWHTSAYTITAMVQGIQAQKLHSIEGNAHCSGKLCIAKRLCGGLWPRLERHELADCALEPTVAARADARELGHPRAFVTRWCHRGAERAEEAAGRSSHVLRASSGLPDSCQMRRA